MKPRRGMQVGLAEVGLSAVILHVLILTLLSIHYEEEVIRGSILIAIVIAIYGYCMSSLTEMFKGNQRVHKLLGIMAWCLSVGWAFGLLINVFIF